MKLSPPTNPPFSILGEPELCPECKSGSRLANGLCLNCLFRGALEKDAATTSKEAFKEALAAVRSRDGDWSIGDHEILDEIARGGMGMIYRAREPHSGRIVALKCLLTYQGDTDQALARFRREAEMAARLDHPNIVPIYHVGEMADGSPFFTMKYATGGSLLEARGKLMAEPRQSVLLMAKVARAVQYAHKQGILHRDLKPGNILFDGHGEPLVSDFGLARCEEIASHFTRSLTSFGTPGYMAPEQADGPAAQLTPAADIYSLGAILFELLAGRPPFQGENALGVMKKSSAESAPKLRTLAPQLDRDLETICARCLERDPSARYPSAESLAQDLESWLEGRAIVARPIGPWIRCRRWLRDNRRLAALLVAFLILAVASVGWQIRARRLQSAMQESILTSHSVVVLPFLDLDQVIPDSITAQSLAASLEERMKAFGPARMRTLPDASALSLARPEDVRKASQETGARMILTGTVRTVEGKKRVSFRLVAPATNDALFTYVWEAKEPNEPTRVEPDVIRQMYEILGAKDWDSMIQSKLDPALRNDIAKEAITAGRGATHSEVSEFDRAIALFQKALRFEPSSSLAHSYLSIEYTARTHDRADRNFLELGKKEASEALRLSPDSSDAHRAMAGVYYQEGKLSGALEEELRAIELGGLEERVGCFVGLTLDTLGRPHQALKWYALASKLTGTLGEVDALIGDCWARLGDDEQAVSAYRRAAELRPDPSEGLLGLSHVRLLQSNFEEARKLCQTAGAHRTPGDAVRLAAEIEFFARNFSAAGKMYDELCQTDAGGGGSFYGAITYQSALGRIKQALGDTEGAGVLLKESLANESAVLAREPENPESAYRLAAVESSLGLAEASFQHLRQAMANGWIDYRSLELDPRFDALRSNPEFQSLIRNISAKVADIRSTTQSNN
jgi:serine/threonine protein kinase/tetratricopeptide (TPR) repeat protein